jgi:taurine dioxygenase
MGMEINVLGPGIGAEILGIDVRTLDEGDFTRIYRAWLDHNVIAVRGQTLTVEEFLTYSRRFGRLHRHPSKATRHPEHPELTVMGINKFHADGSLNQAVYARGGATWHTDGAYDRVPFKATQLYALAIPSSGGDTLFASMYRAYERLPPSLKERLDGRVGAFTYGGRTERSSALLDPEDRAHPPALHPLVTLHPETGRKGLYFDPGKILRIEGLEAAQSDALIEELTERMVDDEGVYRHRWRVGDIVIWDNRCCYHRAAADYPPEEDRIHWRVSIKESGLSTDGTELGAT